MRSEAGLITLLLVVGLTGCAGEPPLPSPSSSEGPAVSESEAGGQVPLPAGVVEYNEAILACMRDRGWDGFASGDSITWDPVPLDQGSQFEADSEECIEAAQGVAPISAPMSNALLELNFDRTQAAYECYVQNGLPAEDVPSFQNWRDLFERGTPYQVSSVLRAQDPAAADAARATCPEPFEFFFDPVTRIYESQVDYAAYEAAVG